MLHVKWSRCSKAVRKIGFFVGSAILIVVGVLAIRSQQSLIDNGYAVAHTLRVDRELEKVLFFMIDAETNERGYLLTGKKTYLERYEKMIGDNGIEGQVQALRALSTRDPEQRQYVNALEPLVHLRVTEMEEAVRARRARGLEAARAVVLQNFARRTTDKIRYLVGEMHDKQNERLTLQTETRDESARRSMVHVLVGSVLATGLLIISSGLLRNEIIQRKRSEEMVRQLNSELEARVQQRTEHLELAKKQVIAYARDLELANVEMLERLAHAGEFRDDDTGQHTRRVGLTASLLAEKLGFSREETQRIQQASRLHDLGKIGISDLILLKEGPLTQEEFAAMKTHTLIGAALFQDGRSDLILLAECIASSHHERWDGNGYPHGLKGEEIPMPGRITAVADVFDALTHERPYKAAWPVEKAVAEIKNGSGKQFDPKVVEAFLSLPHTELV